MLARRLSRRGLTLSAGAVAAVLSPAAAAGMPPALVVATVKAASRLAAGQAAGGITSAQVAALTEGVIKAMLLSKLKIATVVLLALSAVVGLAIASRAGAGPGNEPTQPRQTARAASPQPPAKPAAKASRADQLKALRADYRKEYDELLQAVRAGKVKVKDGGVPEIAELRKRFAERARRLIDADPKDEVALEAILFSLHDLVADADDTKLYEVLTAHHLASPKLGSVVGRPNADEKFLRAVATKSPHAEARARAALALATLLARADRPREAEALLDKILQDKEAAKLSHHHGNLGKAAEDLRFEIRHLSPGKAAPELEGVDQDDKPLKLSDYRGKVVLLVFWATWCGPCMAMVPHERELVKRYAGRPFAVVGVNGDGDIAYPPGEKPIDNKAKVKAIMKREGITWRSFRDALKDPVTNRWQVPGISRKWNVDGWPTVFVIDHQGVIRHRFLGVPDKADLDAAVKKLVAAAGAKKQDSK
jgi:thiol-disulfide isomerase/thioredoxin